MELEFAKQNKINKKQTKTKNQNKNQNKEQNKKLFCLEPYPGEVQQKSLWRNYMHYQDINYNL